MSYESSNLLIRIWRCRWYLYALLLHIKNYINIELWIDILLGEGVDENITKKIKSSWNDIKRHVELSKMYKYSSKYKRDNDEFL